MNRVRRLAKRLDDAVLGVSPVIPCVVFIAEVFEAPLVKCVADIVLDWSARGLTVSRR
jgi:hypothetical protein